MRHLWREIDYFARPLFLLLVTSIAVVSGTVTLVLIAQNPHWPAPALGVGAWFLGVVLWTGFSALLSYGSAGLLLGAAKTVDAGHRALIEGRKRGGAAEVLPVPGPQGRGDEPIAPHRDPGDPPPAA